MSTDKILLAKTGLKFFAAGLRSIVFEDMGLVLPNFYWAMALSVPSSILLCLTAY
jgi:hypothetical protein